MLGVKRYGIATLLLSGLMLGACGTESASEATVDTVAIDTTSVETSSKPVPASTAAIEPTTTMELVGTTPPPTTSASSAPTAAPVATPPTATEPTGASTRSSDCTNDPYVILSIFEPYYDEAALIVQRRLVELGYDVGEVNGYFGWDSIEGLEAWGLDARLEAQPYNVDGNVIDDWVLEELGVVCPGPKTGCELDVNPEAPTEFSDTGRKVQERLATLGYAPGDVDGYIGPNSIDAIQQWNQDGSKRLYYWGEGSTGFSITEKGFKDLGISCP